MKQFTDSEIFKAVKRSIIEADTCHPQYVCYMLEELYPELAEVITYSRVEEEIVRYEEEIQ